MIKEIINYIKEQPYKALADILFVLGIFALTYGIITLSAIIFSYNGC
jgi:hypothetical protein|tara:strand:+ start:1047 stop:1187 length:141 start_codon:yes stop_codon:yes gene_type:complete